MYGHPEPLLGGSCCDERGGPKKEFRIFVHFIMVSRLFFMETKLQMAGYTSALNAPSFGNDSIYNVFFP